MNDGFSWIHISDVHFGSETHSQNWPTIKTALAEDVQKIVKRIGSLDFILISGDIAYSAKEEQYSTASVFFNELNEMLNSNGSNPYFLMVPGNHDIVRPDESDPMHVTLKHHYHEKPINDAFWHGTNNAYKDFTQNMFKNYAKWEWASEKKKPADYKTGILPGDFCCTLQKGNFKIGIIGLNTAFMQFYSGDAYKKIEISPIQLNALTDNDPDKWCKSNTINLLVTHHGCDWYSEEAYNSYCENIYANGRFFAHYYGHMHKAYMLEASEGGAKPKRYRQGISLFGTSKTRDGFERIHGYSAHSIAINAHSQLVEEFYPRRAIKLHDGSYKLAPDYQYNIEEEKLILLHNPSITLNANNAFSLQDDTVAGDSVVFSEEHVSRDINKAIVEAFCKKISIETRNSLIRANDIEAASKILESGIPLWIESEWGLNKESFIDAVALKAFRSNEIFTLRIDCDNADDENGLYRVIKEQTNLELHELIANLPCERIIILVLDNISNDLLNNNLEFLNCISSIISDSANNTKAILSTRCHLPSSLKNSIKIKALDRHDAEIYIKHDPKLENIKLDQDTIEVIFTRTSGVPMLIDHITDQLRYVDIGEVTPFERSIDESLSSVPYALRTAFARLSAFKSNEYSRALLLLKILAFLPNGEVLKKVKYAFNNTPIHISSVSILESLSLIESTSKSVSFTYGSGVWLARFNFNEPLIKVPRQIREFILSTMPETEKYEMLCVLFKLYFGDDWRSGTIQLPTNQELGSKARDITGPGNEYELVRYMLFIVTNHAVHENIAPILHVASSYVLSLMKANRYRDVVTLTKDLDSIFNTQDKSSVTELYITRARALRMLCRTNECIDIIDNLISENLLSTKTNICDAYLALALAHKYNNDTDKAKSAALKLLKAADKKSDYAVHGAEILIELESSDTKVSAMSVHERRCRKKEHIVVANNAALWLASNDADDTKLAHLQRVIDSKTDTYNMVRAAAMKINYIFGERPDLANTISNMEKDIVRFGYTLNFSQRMSGAFTLCHEALWHILRGQNRFADLFKLFRYSSLVWRLGHSLTTEERFCSALKSILESKAVITAVDQRDLGYFQTRDAAIAHANPESSDS